MGSAFSNSTLQEELKKAKDLWHNRCASEQQGSSLEENIETIHRELKKIQEERKTVRSGHHLGSFWLF